MEEGELVSVDDKKRSKDKKKHKKSKKNEDGSTSEERRQRKQERKERKSGRSKNGKSKSKRKERSGSTSSAPLSAPKIPPTIIREGSPSWTSTSALVPNAAAALDNQVQILKATSPDRANLMRSETGKSSGKTANDKRGRPSKDSSDLSDNRSTNSSSVAPSAAVGASGLTVEGLSVEETNKVRAALGLKPLQVGGSSSSAAKKQEDVHAPPVNLSDVKRTGHIKEKLATVKEKRQVEKKLRSVKGLGDASDEDESVEAWVQKNMLAEKRKAELRAKMENDMDNAADAEDDADLKRRGPVGPPMAAYTSRDLGGLTVEHDVDQFQEGKDMVLTLKDAGVLDENGQDILVSSVLTEEEKLKQNIENRKKKPSYNPYEGADELEEPGVFKMPQILKKYDEEIDGERKKAFTIESGGITTAAASLTSVGLEVRVHLGELQHLLATSSQTLARDYYNEEEMAAKFKKGRRNKGNKTRRNTDSDDVKKEDRALVADYGETDRPLLARMTVDEEQDDVELQMALNRARRLRQQERMPVPDNSAPTKGADNEFLRKIKAEPMEEIDSIDTGLNFTLDETSEFCRAVGSLPGTKVAKEEQEPSIPYQYSEVVDMELDEISVTDERKGGWSEVPYEAEPANLGSDEEEDSQRPSSGSRSLDRAGRTIVARSILDDEPTCERGIGAALQLAVKKGLLDQQGEGKKQQTFIRGKTSSIPIQTYTIEDKIIDDDKRGRHERYQGPTVPFKDKDHYKPGFRLEYHDASGRSMDAKEAFRDLSHKFHGKGPGKLKTERRSKKYQEEKLLMEMSSVDTPLHTVEKMMQKQQELQTPYILLSGPTAKGPTPISKRPNV